MKRYTRSLGRAITVVVLVAGLAVVRMDAAAAPDGFDNTKVTSEFVAGSMDQPVAADWLPNGLMLVLGRTGKIYVTDTAAGTSRAIYSVPDIYSDGEAGALDVIVDPNIASNRTIYLYYSGGDTRLRIGKLVLDSASSPTAVVANDTIWSNPGALPQSYFGPTDQIYHVGGSLDIGPDGKFYLSIGDLVHGESQNLTNVFGKVNRINRDGTIPTDNPFYDGDGPRADEIWAYGLRNPYRIAWDRTRTPADPVGSPSGFLWVGDVGGNVDATAEEEVDIVEAGKNYGWPDCEGPLIDNPGARCPSGVTGPVHYYPHVAGSSCCISKAVVGGRIYHGSAFPLEGVYIYTDFAGRQVSWLQLTADGRTEIASGLIFNDVTMHPVWLDVGPDGKIYYIDIVSGQLRRLNYNSTSGGQPPTITTASASPVSGAAPLTVSFNGAATDPFDRPLSYLWRFGDNTTSTSQSPVHTYQTSAPYTARLSVTAGADTVNSDPLSIAVGSPPTVDITSPANKTSFSAGQTFTLNGSATDAIDGPLVGTSLQWTIEFKHNTHAHPVETGSGTSIVVTVPTTGHSFAGDTGFIATLTATNSFGLSTSRSVELVPAKISQTISANIPVTATVDSIAQSLPFLLDTIDRFQTSVSVPASACVAGTTRTFASWSDGGDRSHIVTGAGVLNAVYTDSGQRCDDAAPPAGASQYVAVSPLRIYDSRQIGPRPGAGSITTVQVGGLAGVPTTGVTAVVLNVTATESAGPGFVTAFPTGSATPLASNVNLDHAAETTANLVTVPIGANGSIDLLTKSAAHLVVDVFGYYRAVSVPVRDGRFVPLAPTRLLDTRSGAKPGAGATLTIPIAGTGGVPASGATGVVLNVTAVDAAAPGYVTVWPADLARPGVSNLNVEFVGEIRANQVVVGLGASGALSFFTQTGTHLLVDVVGYFTANSGTPSDSGLFVPAGPGRVLDTRTGALPAPESTLSTTVAGHLGIPPIAARAIVANVTAVQGTNPGFVTAWADGTTRPGTSNLNVAYAGQTVPNHSTIELSASGAVELYTHGGGDLLIDISGWYTA